MRELDPTGMHSGLYQNNYTQAENQKFTEQFSAITEEFKMAMENSIDPKREQVQELVRKHYEFCLQFWKPTKEAYKSLALSYIMPSPYRDTYEGVAAGLAQYHYDAIVEWADKNL